jgi:hypothetical protein
MIDYLCPEGQRLWDEWDKLRINAEMDYIQEDKRAALIAKTNAAWTVYQDHRMGYCQECTKLRTHKATKP